jgi:hypothetical protein
MKEVQMNSHLVKVAFTFEAEVQVQAQDLDQAHSIVLESFGCVGPSWQTSDDRIASWDAGVHAEKCIRVLPQLTGLRQEGGLVATGKQTWKQIAELQEKASVAVMVRDLSEVGVELVKLFVQNADLESVEIKLSKACYYSDDSDAGLAYFVNADIEWKDLDGDDVAGESVDGDLRGFMNDDVIEEGLRHFMNDDLCKAVISASTDRRVRVRMQDVQHFLAQTSFDGFDVFKALALIDGSGVDAALGGMEVDHVG